MHDDSVYAIIYIYIYTHTTLILKPKILSYVLFYLGRKVQINAKRIKTVTCTLRKLKQTF